MPRLRPREDADGATIAAWIGDAAALRLFTGTRLSWPLDAEQLARMTRVEGFSAWVLVDDVDGAVAGHADLAVQKEDAHVGRVIIDPRRRTTGSPRDDACPVAGRTGRPRSGPAPRQDRMDAWPRPSRSSRSRPSMRGRCSTSR